MSLERRTAVAKPITKIQAAMLESTCVPHGRADEATR